MKLKKTLPVWYGGRYWKQPQYSLLKYRTPNPLRVLYYPKINKL
jgi:hypothetical protein